MTLTCIPQHSSLSLTSLRLRKHHAKHFRLFIEAHCGRATTQCKHVGRLCSGRLFGLSKYEQEKGTRCADLSTTQVGAEYVVGPQQPGQAGLARLPAVDASIFGCGSVNLPAYQVLEFSDTGRPSPAIPVPFEFRTDVSNATYLDRHVPLPPQTGSWGIDPNALGPPLGPINHTRSDTGLSLCTDDSNSTGFSSSSQASFDSVSGLGSMSTMGSISSSGYACPTPDACFVDPTTGLGQSRSTSTPLPQLGNNSAQYHHIQSNPRSYSFPYHQRDDSFTLAEQQQQWTCGDVGTFTLAPMTQEPEDMFDILEPDQAWLRDDFAMTQPLPCSGTSHFNLLYTSLYHTSPHIPTPATAQAPTPAEAGIVAGALEQNPYLGHSTTSQDHTPPSSPRTRRRELRETNQFHEQTGLLEGYMKCSGGIIPVTALAVPSSQLRVRDRIRKQNKAKGRVRGSGGGC